MFRKRIHQPDYPVQIEARAVDRMFMVTVADIGDIPGGAFMHQPVAHDSLLQSRSLFMAGSCRKRSPEISQVGKTKFATVIRLTNDPMTACLSGSAPAETYSNGQQQNAYRRLPPGRNPGCGGSW